MSNLFGKQSSSTQANSTQTTDTTESNIQGNSGTTVSNNTGPVFVTDGGAIAANSDVSKAAIALGSTAIGAGVSLANKGLDNAIAAEQAGLTFGTNALDTVTQLISQSQGQVEQLVGDALSGYQSIAAQNSASSSTQLQKVAIYAIAALVLILIVPRMFK